MKDAVTIYYCGQGCIYRCPECHKADRLPYDRPPATKTCRFCEKEFELIQVSSMNDELYGVIQEINAPDAYWED
jgi:hypothetical protein